MKELTPTLKNIRKFFELIYYKENATREEVYNFLQELLKFVFEENKINIKDFDITFHCFKQFPVENCSALMIANEKYDNKFDVLLRSESLKFKSADDTAKMLYYIDVCLHEFGHIMQYVLKPEVMEIFDEDTLATRDFIYDLKNAKHRTRFDRKVQKEFEKYNEAQDILSFVEKDASKRAYLYYRSMLDQLIVHETDDELADFYSTAYTNLQLIRKDDFDFYRKHVRQRREAVKFLTEHNFIKEFELTLS